MDIFMQGLNEKQKTMLGATVVITLVLIACMVAALPSLPAMKENKEHEPRNVFEEIYEANGVARGMTDQVEGISYAHDIFQYDAWYGDESVLYYSSESGRLIITCTKEIPTITFTRDSIIGDPPNNEYYHYTYRYEFETQTLTYTTNDARRSNGDRFLFDVFLPAWYEGNHPDKEQPFKTDFSPEDWGAYEMVITDLDK